MPPSKLSGSKRTESSGQVVLIESEGKVRGRDQTPLLGSNKFALS